MKLLTRILLVAVVLLVVAELFPGIHISGVSTAIIAAVILGLLNAVVRPVLIILTLPVTVLTLGLFLLVINALLFWFAASFLDGFDVSGFWAAFFGSLVVSVASSIGNRFIK